MTDKPKTLEDVLDRLETGGCTEESWENECSKYGLCDTENRRKCFSEYIRKNWGRLNEEL